MNELTTEADLETALVESEKHPVFLFKHSTRCSISAAVHGRVTGFIEGAPEGTPPFHLVKVIEARPVSNAVVVRLGVTHESPQLILVRGGRAVWDASHHQIGPSEISEAVAAHT
jgi:bacillithiol system protein YtxJ